MTDRLNMRRLGMTASWTVLGLLLACSGGEALAQTDASDQAAVSEDGVPDQDAIIVVGSRASQQSANARKKNARTATDSIVADDIGSFPDRNVNEAISRIPGVALGRNDFGEGESVAVRGNGPDLTRVELDGIGVQSTNALAISSGASGTGGGGPGRSADLREIPAELVKSVDVVKGSTAEMTEGGLGGTIQIKTRTGLDFKKPYISLRGGVGQNTLGKEWTPDFNAVVANRFLNGRLGVIASGSFARVQNNGHTYENVTSNARNYQHRYDFDNSPEKTFTFNPATVGTDAADVAFADSTAPDGTTLTPRELVTLSAGATSKAQCLTIFPYNSTASNAARIQRTMEQQTCLNQWNDYAPSLIRHFMNEQTDTRYSFDARVDYRLTDNLTIFAKGTVANRKTHDQNRGRTPVNVFQANAAGTFTDSTTGYPRTRSVSLTAPTGYYLYDQTYGLNTCTTTCGGSSTNTFPVGGNVLNLVPGSMTIDSAHNLTKFTTTNNSVQIDQIENTNDTKTKYAQAGVEYRGDRLEIDLWGGITKASSTRGDMRTNRTYTYGDATLTLQPNGLWDIDLPANYNEADPANYVQMRPATGAIAAVTAGPNAPASPAYTIAQQPLTSSVFSVSYSPAIAETSEKIGKFDLSYKTEGLIPFITRFKVGAMWRNNEISRWGGGGYTRKPAVGTFGAAGYVPAVIIPTANVRGSLRACEPTATSSAPGGLSCNFGYVPATNPANIRSGVDTLTPAQLQDLFTRTLEPVSGEYFGDLPNRGNLPPAWQGIRTDELFAQLGAAPFINFDCVKTCMASDGQVYDQPVTRAKETIKNVYGMIDFETPLLFGVLFNGNFGVRGVFVDSQGSGLQTLSQIRVTASYNAANPNAAAGITTTSYAIPVSFERSSTDWLPSFNFNFWGFNQSVVLRLYGGKTVARPSLANITPGGNCVTFDEREALDPTPDDFNCSGRVGNPGLKPFTAWSYNASLEWYANADTLFSVTFGKLDVSIGNPIAVTELRKPFAGSSEVDPVNGAPLADIEFLVPTFANGPGYKRNIWEFSAKTAFTFLPWIFRHTGFDANFSILASAVTTGQQDPNTGDVMLPPNESKYYTNASLWYDDGKLNLRLAYQKRSATFLCITPCGGNNDDTNYPGEGWTNVRLVGGGYVPGVPRFQDATEFFDAKASYNITPNFQIYLEGRNLRRETQSTSTGTYVPFADGTQKLMKLAYSGRRVMGGVRIQFGGGH